MSLEGSSPQDVNISNPTQDVSSVAVVARVPVTPVSSVILAANPKRTRAIITNESGTLKVKYGPGASITDYTVELLSSAGNSREIVVGYSGAISAIKSSGNTFVQVTEI